MRSRAYVVCCAFAGVFVSSGCGNLEGELLDALQVKEHQVFCVQPSLLGVDAFEANDGKRYVAKAGDFSFMSSGSAVHALDQLKAKGYVSNEAVSLPANFANYFDAFEITDKGAEYFRPDEFSGSMQVCIGEKTATEVIEYTEPPQGGPQAIQARFRYKVTFNDLVDDLGVEDALRGEVSRAWPGEGLATYMKTNKGWRLEHAMWQ